MVHENSGFEFLWDILGFVVGSMVRTVLLHRYPLKFLLHLKGC